MLPGPESPTELVAVACRILAVEGLAREISGHVSMRPLAAETMWIRCRSAEERGLLYTEASSIAQVLIDDPATGDDSELRAPLESQIHSGIYRARADVRSVVHAHAPAAMICATLPQGIRPVVGAYDPIAVRMVLDGLPVFPSARLVRSPAEGESLAATLGDRSACLMAGHGLVAVGATVEEAVVRALKLENLARLSLRFDRAGSAYSVDDEAQRDLAGLAEEKSSVLKNQFRWTFQHYAQAALCATESIPVTASRLTRPSAGK